MPGEEDVREGQRMKIYAASWSMSDSSLLSFQAKIQNFSKYISSAPVQVAWQTKSLGPCLILLGKHVESEDQSATGIQGWRGPN